MLALYARSPNQHGAVTTKWLTRMIFGENSFVYFISETTLWTDDTHIVHNVFGR